MKKLPIIANFDASSAVLAAFWGLLMLLTAVVYWPGLGGPFVLDDFGSIAALGNRGGVVDWETFKAFVMGGTSGPTGRPISLLSFLVDANNWPAESWPFKRTNLLIHCMCGVLLGVLVRQLLGVLGFGPREASVIALAAAGVWLLHPFLVSTTLYVVQRMAQLSTLFSLAGLIFYLRGRVLLPSDARRAYWQMTIALALFGLLAVFSKENGILLPVLVGSIEMTIIASQRARLGHLNRYWLFACIAMPTLIIFAYLAVRLFSGSFFDIVPPRDFSLFERALTQPRILFDYLQHWFIPKLYTSGVFQDHFVKSTGLLTPITTLMSILAHIGIIAIAIIKRRSWPLFALAALFFYSAHLLESTVMNLELYFEHRNYLASAFLFLPLLVALQQKIGLRNFALISITVCLLLGSFTRYSAGVWATWPGMVEASARKAPMSARAQAQYSVLLFNAGHQEESIEVLNQAIARIPDASALLIVNRLVTLCEMQALSGEELEIESSVLAEIPYDARMLNAFTALADAVASRACPEAKPAQLNSLFLKLLTLGVDERDTSLEYSQLQYLLGLTYVQVDQVDAATTAFQRSLHARPGASHAMQMAAVLASAGFGREALEFSDIALAGIAAQPPGAFSANSVSVDDIRVFQKTVREDLKSEIDASKPREAP